MASDSPLCFLEGCAHFKSGDAGCCGPRIRHAIKANDSAILTVDRNCHREQGTSTEGAQILAHHTYAR